MDPPLALPSASLAFALAMEMMVSRIGSGSRVDAAGEFVAVAALAMSAKASPRKSTVVEINGALAVRMTRSKERLLPLCLIVVMLGNWRTERRKQSSTESSAL